MSGDARTGEPWSSAKEAPPWLWQREPSTTGLLGQEGLKLWVAADRAAVGIRAGGVVYPVFPFGVDPALELSTRRLLAQVSDAWCLMGPSSWVAAAEPLMPPSVVTHRVDYEFLVRPRAPLAVPPGPGALRKAESGDANALYPLQEGYEKEEVLFREEDFSPLACRLHLGKLLRQQEIVGLWENGKPVAKAGTNAMTSSWAQIGGVYTRPEHRGQGHQKRLMAFLLHRLDAQGRSACLFVKTKNEPALALYRSLGFAPQEPLQITYGNRRR